MGAVTFVSALAAVRGRSCSNDARACVRALEYMANVELELGLDVPTLRHVHRKLREDAQQPQGRLACRIILAERVPLIIALVADGTTLRKPLSKEQAASLHADAWMVLDAWVRRWNVGQIRLVKGVA